MSRTALWAVQILIHLHTGVSCLRRLMALRASAMSERWDLGRFKRITYDVLCQNTSARADRRRELHGGACLLHAGTPAQASRRAPVAGLAFADYPGPGLCQEASSSCSRTDFLRSLDLLPEEQEPSWFYFAGDSTGRQLWAAFLKDVAKLDLGGLLEAFFSFLEQRPILKSRTEAVSLILEVLRRCAESVSSIEDKVIPKILENLELWRPAWAQQRAAWAAEIFFNNALGKDGDPSQRRTLGESDRFQMIRGILM
eukprot:g20367.t1